MYWRFLNTNYNNAAINMAIDEALLYSKKPVLRCYRWKPPALSIGYFQTKADININRCKQLGIDIVRRITGGGAVLHDKELTYCVVMPEQMLPNSVIESYKVISKAILIALKSLGLNPIMHIPSRIEKNPNCFANISWYEIIVNNKKIVGSAQTRINKKVLQHGSIPIDIDIEKLSSLFKNSKKIFNKTKDHMTALNLELDYPTSYNKVMKALKLGFRNAFNIKFIEDNLTKKELSLAKLLAEKKYSQGHWNFMR